MSFWRSELVRIVCIGLTIFAMAAVPERSVAQKPAAARRRLP